MSTETSAAPLPVRATHRMGPPSAFTLQAAISIVFLAASSAPTPLYAMYQSSMQLSALVITVIFAAYSIALLVALLVVGALSDYVGRRTVIIAALILELAAMILFAVANVPELIAARALQGLATGAATAALAAGLTDLFPLKAPVMNSVAPILGMAAGALGSAALTTVAVFPTVEVFVVLAVLFTALLIAAIWLPETAVRKSGAWKSLAIRLTVPEAARGPLLYCGTYAGCHLGHRWFRPFPGSCPGPRRNWLRRALGGRVVRFRPDHFGSHSRRGDALHGPVEGVRHRRHRTGSRRRSSSSRRSQPSKRPVVRWSRYRRDGLRRRIPRRHADHYAHGSTRANVLPCCAHRLCHQLPRNKRAGHRRRHVGLLVGDDGNRPQHRKRRDRPRPRSTGIRAHAVPDRAASTPSTAYSTADVRRHDDRTALGSPAHRHAAIAATATHITTVVGTLRDLDLGDTPPSPSPITLENVG